MSILHILTAGLFEMRVLRHMLGMRVLSSKAMAHTSARGNHHAIRATNQFQTSIAPSVVWPELISKAMRQSTGGEPLSTVANP